jgi:hypothetical protein
VSQIQGVEQSALEGRTVFVVEGCAMVRMPPTKLMWSFYYEVLREQKLNPVFGGTLGGN